jgi:FdhD protein
MRIREDHLAAEEPLEIRLNGKPLVVTMRTPGHDIELAHGFLVSEGVIHRRDQVAVARYCAGATDEGVNTYNVLDVALAPDVAVPDFGLERNVYTSSSCGVCGKASIDAVETASRFPVENDDVEVGQDLITALPDRLRQTQEIFARTGGLHAAGLFDARTGELLVSREDVGRHNAVDKVIGWAIGEDRLPLNGTVLMLSGRAGFELVQKASMAGVPVIAAVSAPSSLAVELAARAGITLLGFIRNGSMVGYTRTDRIAAPLRLRLDA